MAGTFTSLHYHLVFSTKDRMPLITAEIQERLYEYIGGIVRSESESPKRGGLVSIGGIADHVHMLVRWPPNRTVSDLMRVVKSKSSRWVNETFPEAEGRFAWQEGYGAFSVSKSDVSKVVGYIDKQAEHHAERGFKDEFRRFLEVNGIDCDESTIWL